MATTNEKSPQPDKASSPSGDSQWALRAFADIRNDIEKLDNRLREDIGKMENRLQRLQMTVWIAVGGITAVIGLVGWVFRPVIAVIAEKMMTS